jgi:ferric-dicitrate binding protein FerR (iron transport regulator)
LFYRGVEREQASDLAQDVFMRVWEKQLTVDPKIALRLLYKIAGDMFVSRYRRETLEMNYRKSLKNDVLDFSPEDQLRYKQLFENYTKTLAAFALLVGISIPMQVYTKNLTIPTGQHSDIFLPDHSRVRLNAETSLSYKPLKWIFSRQVKLEGEAYFEVRPGKKFEVISGHGKTAVLGTSFNIYSRNNHYQVTCVTGKVRVTESKRNTEVIILQGQKAALNPLGSLEVQSGVNANQILSWLENKLSFTSVPLKQVFEEIGRQYGTIILIPENLENTYTGTFNRQTSIEQTLNLVCKPFNLSFSLKSKDEYIITRNN